MLLAAYIKKFQPHSPSLSPLGKERCCTANPIYITTTSTSVLYSPLSNISFLSDPSKSEGCALASLPPRRRDLEGAVFYLTNPAATPPSTFKILPVDLFSNPPTKAKHAFAISSGLIISCNNVLLA